MTKLFRTIVLALCFICVVGIGVRQSDASEVAPYNSAFGGFSLGFSSQIGTRLPFVGATGIYDTQLRYDGYTVGLMGTANYTFEGEYGESEASHLLFLSPMICVGTPAKNSISHVGFGIAMLDGQSPQAGHVSTVRLTASASYTYYIQTANTERFAINFGVQWFQDAGFMFTISPGFLSLGSRR